MQVGDKINRLTIDKFYFRQFPTQRKQYAICTCECGKECDVRVTDIKRERIKSCGCWRAEKARERTINRNYKHGKSEHPLMNIWSTMKNRCDNPNHIGYHNYGGRGIVVCDKWKEYINFYNWAMENSWQKGLTVDRKNNDGNYSPTNCRLITQKENCRNTSRNVLLTCWGETKTMIEWSEDNRCGIGYQTLKDRIGKLGWTHENAVSTPARCLNKIKT